MALQLSNYQDVSCMHAIFPKKLFLQLAGQENCFFFFTQGIKNKTGSGNILRIIQTY